MCSLETEETITSRVYSPEWLKSQGLVFNGKTLPYNPNLFERAKELRKKPTKEENHLWYDFLSTHAQKFTRQKVIGHYIIDFYCASHGLVIEVDGSRHYTDNGLAYDAIRTDYLEQFDISVLRFTNEQIRTTFTHVCTKIDQLLDVSPHTGRAIGNPQSAIAASLLVKGAFSEASLHKGGVTQ